MNARNREEEYLRRMKALGYEPSLAGMDDDDIEWELSKMEGADRRREAEWQQPEQPLRTVYRPVDPGLKARILRMFGQPHDESAIPKGQEFYLNGWDNGDDEEEWPALKPAPRVPTPPGNRTMKPDLHGITYDPETGKITPNENGGFEIKGWELPGQRPFWKNVANIFSPSRGGTYMPLSYTAGGNEVNTGGRGMNTAAANPYAGGYADGGAYGDMLFGVTGVTPQQPKQYVSADQLTAFGWQNVDDKMVRDLNDALIKYEITTPARIRHFLSQTAKESGLGEKTTELYDGDPYEHFENKYGRAKRLGNSEEGDGYRYRGGGYIQLTGKNNYREFGKEVNDDDVLKVGAEHVAKKYPWMASAFWWHKLNQMNDLVDKFDDSDTDADVEMVTRKVNGEPDWDDPEDVEKWRASLKERQAHYKRSRGIFRD